MEISESCVVGLTWTLRDTLGEVLDVLEEPVEFLIGGSDLLAVIEAALMGHGPGARVQLHIEPEQAFGDFDDRLLLLVPRASFPYEIREGMVFESSALPKGASGDVQQDAIYTVSEIYPEHLVLDGNHPLAGIALRLDIEVKSVREATPEEISNSTAGAGFFTVPTTAAPGNNLLH